MIAPLVLSSTLMAAVGLPAERPHLVAVRTTTPPLIDGRLDDAAWRAAPGDGAFTQSYPFDGAAPTEKTVVRVVYDHTDIYIGFDCEQIHTTISQHLTRRDRDSESDWVYLHLDSRNDGKSAFMFAVNVAGVLADAQIIDQTTTSWEWDENWEARTARTATGWSAEIRIPLRVLRFDGKLPVQSWGFQASRYIGTRQETDMWSYVPRDVAAPIPFFGRLDGLRDLRGAGALELQPFGVAFGPRRDTGQSALGCAGQACGSAGFDLKLHIAQDLTFDAAVNPDFAEVELDQVVLDLSNYETFLPEKRPFFLEGIDAFSFPMQVFYSRRIGAAPFSPSLRTDATGPYNEQLVHTPSPATIYGAGKLVGRLGPNWTIGALTAVTGPNDVTVDDSGVRSSRLAAPATSFNVLRIKRELGATGHIGVIGTAATAFEHTGDYPPVTVSGSTAELCPSGVTPAVGSRCFHDAYVGGVDGLWRSPSGAYVVNGAFVESYLHGGPTVQQLDGTSIGAGAIAPGGWLRVAKEGGKHVVWSAEYTGAGRALNYNDLGYMQRQNVQTLSTSIGWRTLDPGKHTFDTTSSLVVSESRNLSELELGQSYELNTRLHMRNYTSIFFAADYAPARFDDREVGDGTALERAGWLGGRVELDSDPRRHLYATVADQTQVVGVGIYSTSVQASLLLHALPQLDIELLPQLMWAAGEYRYGFLAVGTSDPYLFGKLASKSVSGTLRASYTFTPRLTLQAYAQAFLAAGHFDNLKSVPRSPGSKIRLSDLAALPDAPVPATTPDFEEAALNLNVVFRWEYRLGSLLYLVYTHSQFPAVATFAAPATLNPGAFSQGTTADVILLKLSYWWAS